MICTIISIIFAVAVVFLPLPQEIVALNWGRGAFLIVAISFALLLFHYFLECCTMMQLQKAEKNFTPRVISLYRQDRGLKLTHLFFSLFPLVTLIMVSGSAFFNIGNKADLFAVWIILFGISLDLFSHAFKKTFNYLNPFAVVRLFTHAARKSIQDERESDLCDWIDALTESAIKAIYRSNISLCNDVLQELQITCKNFLEASKSISHHEIDSQSEKMGISDKISFTLSYFFQRIQLINEKALEMNLEPICSTVITTLGKVAVHAAKLDISLAGYPLYFLGTCAKLGQKKKIPDIDMKATLTLVEVAKTIPQEIDVTYLELKDTYLILVTQLHEIAKETFRQNKGTRISLLTQPFRELLDLFNTEKLSKHQDAPIIIDAIKQVLAEFETLETVLKTIPPLPDIPESTIKPPPPESTV